MSSQLPPTQNLPIFDNTVFQAGDEGLTYNTAKTQFLTFPSAQGTETLLNTNIVGSLTVTNNLTLTGGNSALTISGATSNIVTNKITFPNSQVQSNSAFATYNLTPTTTALQITDYSNPQYLNSTINLSGSSSITNIKIPTPVTGSYLKIYNNDAFFDTILASTFSGIATQSGTALTVSVVLGTITVGSTIFFNGSNITINSQTSGTTGGVGVYVVSISNTFATASLFVSTGITFGGQWGNSDPQIRFNHNSWSLLYAPSTTAWNIVDRSANQFFDTILISASISYATHYNFLNCTFPISLSNNDFQITIPLPTNLSSEKYFKIINTSTKFFTKIFITAGSFTGPYGSNSSTLYIPENTWYYMYSDGTNWIVTEASPYGLNYYSIITTSSFTLGNQYFSAYNANSSTGVNFILPSPGPNSANLQSTLNMTNVATATTLTVSPAYSYNSGTGVFSVSSILANNILRNNISIGNKYPLVIDFLYFASSVPRTSYTIRPFRTSFSGVSASGSNVITCATTTRLAQISTNNGTTLNIGTIITAGGVNFTITGINTFSALTLTYNTSITVTIATITGFIQPGSALIIDGQEVVVTQTTNIGTVGSVLTISPPLIATTPLTVSGFMTGTGLVSTSNLTYTLDRRPTTALSSTAYTVFQDAYSWLIT